MAVSTRWIAAGAVLAASSPSSAQTFVIDAANVPSATSFSSYQSDFGDVDGDGDPDLGIAVFNGQDRLWINQGGLQNGAAGVYVDESATRLPAIATEARDLDFADLDLDGDLDLHVSGGDGGNGETSRWWINTGGAQGGTLGYYQDQTAARWLDLDAGATSIAPGLVLMSGGFLDHSWDGELGDLDGDGDLDLFHTSVGQGDSGLIPTRVFLNDGTGAFREFNPSGYRLTSANLPTGAPGLWCDGLQAPNTLISNGTQCDVASNSFESEIGDFDSDFDLDFVQGGQPDKPRFFRNRLSGGVLAFRDETGAVFPSGYANVGGYGQGIADLDNDGDLELYGLNWAASLGDHVLVNDGTGSFTLGSAMPASNEDEEDADFLDHDNDGDLDVLLAGYAGSQELYRNDLGGAGGFTKVSTLIQPDPHVAFDNDVADTDLDGDTDFIVANGGTPGCQLFRNTSQVLDTFAPAIPLLEQAPDRNASDAPTSVRAHVYDNTSDYVVAGYQVELEYSVNGGAFAALAMRWSGAQVFRGEIPGQASGAIAYRVRATDLRGNTGLSSTRSFTSSGWASYCTAGTTSNGCAGSITGSGTPSATAGAGFTLLANDVEGQKPALVFYGVNGRIAQPWGTSSSFLCVKAPIQRTGLLTSSGTSGACDGTLSLDWNLYVATHPTAHGQPFAAGTIVDAQAWIRDPPSQKTTAMTNAIEFVVAP